MNSIEPTQHASAAPNTTSGVDVQFFPSNEQHRTAVNTAAILWLRIAGQLDVMNRQALKLRILDELADGRQRFVFDFSTCGYVDGQGLGVLLSTSKKIREARGRLVLVGLNADLRTLFEITKMDRLFEITNGNVAALAALETTENPNA